MDYFKNYLYSKNKKIQSCKYLSLIQYSHFVNSYSWSTLMPRSLRPPSRSAKFGSQAPILDFKVFDFSVSPNLAIIATVKNKDISNIHIELNKIGRSDK